MTIEVDRWLKDNAAILGVNPENVNPHSVDVCLGGHIIEHFLWWKREIRLKEGDTFVFKPFCFYLCHTTEIVHVPTTHAAQLWLKSSIARRALEHLLAGYIDSGWRGQITLEFVAFRFVRLVIGQRVAQLQYSRLSEPPERPYTVTGRYMDSQGAVEAR